MIGQPFRLRRGGYCVVAPCLSHKPMQNLTPALEKTLVGCVLNKRVLKAVGRLRRQTLDQKDVRFGESVYRLLQRGIVHTAHPLQQRITEVRPAKIARNATSRSKGHQGNDAYRVREHLTEAEMDKLLAALKRNRHGHRDWLVGLIIYRHGLRVSEACDLRWDDIDLPKRTIIVRRLKGSTDSVHYLERDE
jgi:integrase